jgi:hypothetical protein
MFVTKQLRSLATEIPVARKHGYGDLYSFMKGLAGQPYNANSRTFRGMLYERLVGEVLQVSARCYSVVHCGRRGDGGVDLEAKIRGPLFKRPIDMLVQCKNQQKKISPHIVREMSGVFTRETPTRKNGILIAIASTNGMSREAEAEMARSNAPMVYWRIRYAVPEYDKQGDQVVCKELENGTAIEGLIFNKAARHLLDDHGIKFGTATHPRNGLIHLRLS